MGWAHRFKPPGGFVDKPASGIPAGGDGWGDATGLKPAFSAEHQPPGEHKGIGRLEAREYRAAVQAKLATKLDVFDRATNAESPIMAQLKAIEMMENRVYGQAKQIIETQADTRTDDEIMADIERRKRELGV